MVAFTFSSGARLVAAGMCCEASVAGGRRLEIPGVLGEKVAEACTMLDGELRSTV